MDSEFTMKDLENIFDYAVSNEDSYIGVLIQMEGFEAPELIINRKVNFNSKLEYYKKTYDENCNHKFANGIKIIDADCSDYMDNLGYSLMPVIINN